MRCRFKQTTITVRCSIALCLPLHVQVSVIGLAVQGVNMFTLISPRDPKPCTLAIPIRQSSHQHFQPLSTFTRVGCLSSIRRLHRSVAYSFFPFPRISSFSSSDKPFHHLSSSGLSSVLVPHIRYVNQSFSFVPATSSGQWVTMISPMMGIPTGSPSIGHETHQNTRAGHGAFLLCPKKWSLAWHMLGRGLFLFFVRIM
ncbi:hypothetical protein EXIGLDRAFT_389249 [Exidia glandulosa HHB12029]|uniref:Uncharacterized protein n=1 Tax=Exidia glandulosa HHB12029 TaxID=1314781 RepID=A0A165ZBE9_EXIGL|nr:hypothetical protein EXIGLDRAFT_389249 [Exidia glandulosa HHB12029]